MSFLGTAFLWGLAMAALPIIIHLVRWGAMQFLMETERQKKKRMRRPAHLLLMLLRMLVIAAIALAFAQPLLQWEALQVEPARDVVIVVDNSMSMAREAGGETLAEQMHGEIAAFVNDLNRRDRVRLLAAAGGGEWIESEAMSGGSSLVKDRLKQTKEVPMATDMPGALLKALRAKPAKRGAGRVVVVFTDGQANGWMLEDTARWAALREEARDAEIRVVTVKSDTVKNWNLVVEKLEVDRAVTAVGEEVSLRALVRNSGEKTSAPVSMRWKSDDAEIGLSTVGALEPGESLEVGQTGELKSVGSHVFRAVLDAEDGILLDNDSAVVVEASQGIPVLVVNGSPHRDTKRSDTRFVSAALAGDGDSLYKVDFIESSSLVAGEMDRYRAIVFANVAELTPEKREALIAFTRGGGGVLLAPGDQIDVEVFNVDFFGDGYGLSPVPLAEAKGDAERQKEFRTIRVQDVTHPAVALLGDEQQLDLAKARVYRQYTFDMSYAAEQAILLETSDGEALAVGRVGDGGRVITLGMPLSLAWSNLPQLHAYVAMLHEWLWFLIEPGLATRNLSPGEAMVESATSEESMAVWKLATANGESVDFAPRTMGSRRIGRYDATQYPGIYSFETSDGGARSLFSVRRDERESDLTPLSAAEQEELGLNFGDAVLESKAGEANEQSPLWQWILLAVLVFLALEALVTLSIQRKRRSPKETTEVEPITF
jgi:Mg-chelatase subunit ChlD